MHYTLEDWDWLYVIECRGRLYIVGGRDYGCLVNIVSGLLRIHSP